MGDRFPAEPPPPKPRGIHPDDQFADDVIFWTFPAFVLTMVVVFVLVVLSAGCDVQVRWKQAEPHELDAAKAEVERIIEANTPPAPQPDPIGNSRVDPDAAPPPPAPPPDPPSPKREPAEPQLPPRWPRGVTLQKWTGDPCPPCVRWDEQERPQLAAVMLPDKLVFSGPQRRSTAEATAAGVTVAPSFELRRGDQVLWVGRGYWTAEQLTDKAVQFGGS